MIYEIVTAAKSDAPTEEALRAALAEHKAGFTVENIDSDENTWTVRLAEKIADGKPPWLDKDKGDSDDSDSSDSSDDSAGPDDESSDSDSDNDSDSDDDSKGNDKGDSKSKKDPSAEVKSVIDQLTTLFTDLGGKVDELQAAHDEKADKLKEINKTVGEDGEGSGPPPGDVADIGPTPGGPGAGGPPVGPPMPAKGLDGRKPGVPGPPGGGIPAFTNYQVATHPGVDDQGKRISLTAAGLAMENDPEFAEYEVVGMTENVDGTFSAKLKLREKE